MLHRFYGYSSNFRESFLVKMVLSGIKSKLGNPSSPKQCLTMKDLRSMYSVMDKSELNLTLWAAVIFGFRTLLRKSYIEHDQNVEKIVTRNDISFSMSGEIVRVGSSKTLRYKEKVLEIPLYWTNDASLCVVSMLRHHFSRFPAPRSSPLFLKKTPKGLALITYSELLTFIKK